MTDISHSDHEPQSPHDERPHLLDGAIAQHGTVARLAAALGVTARTIKVPKIDGDYFDEEGG